MISTVIISVLVLVIFWIILRKLFIFIKFLLNNLVNYLFYLIHAHNLKKVFNHKYNYKRNFTDAEVSYLWNYEDKRFDILFEWILENGIYKIKYKSFKTDKVNYSPRCHITVLQNDRYAEDDEGNMMFPNIDVLKIFFTVDYKYTIEIKYPCNKGVIKIVSEEANKSAKMSVKENRTFVFILEDFETFLELDTNEESVIWLEPRISNRILEESKVLQEQQEREEIERQERIAKLKKEKEKKEEKEIRERILARERKKAKEKAVYNQLLDEGLIFPDESNKRPPIPRDVVDAVWIRDKGQCVYCGSKENLQLDHIIPFSKGGATTFENLQLLCQKCNLKKSNHIG